ncbi:MAG: S8 family serine peptidase [Chloroflexi bacterium]|nr:S8 family serine peptidase [Chloroflexota bacterium]
MSAILMGHDYITANSDSIDVVNLSLGGLGWSDTWRQAVDDNVAAGVVVVVAAGNATRDIYGSDGSLGNGNEHLPAAFPGSLTVSALSDSDGLPGGAGYDSTYGVDDTLTGFTNFGNSVVSNNPITSPGGAIDVAAPGALIQSTMPGNSTGWMSGTSMASPHVAGVVALHIAATGPAKNDADVVAIRQAIVDAGSPMNAWRPDDLDLESDNDSLHEPLVSGAVGYTTSLMSDLAMTASLDNYDALPGDSVIATAIVENTGNVVFDYPARVIITSDNGTPDDPSDDVVLMEQQVPAGLLPGSQVALVTNVETTNLAPGSFVVTAAHLAIDDRPGNNSSSQTLTVTSPPSSPVEPGKVSIEPVTWWSEGGKNRDRHLRLSMTLLDGVAAAVEGAVISVSITHESGKTKVLSGNSGTDGNVEFRINGAVAGLYTLIVTNLSHELNDWDGEQPSNAAFTKP